MTTPLLPDDYIALMNPLWSTRESTATVERVQRETSDTSTVVLRPSFPWPGHQPGQYLRIGAEIDGVRHWRAYSITSDPDHPDGLVSITVKRVEEGRMSPFFNGEIEPGQVVFLGEVEGTFTLPDPVPDKVLMISAGSGITPIAALVRELHRRGGLRDVIHVHSHRNPDDFIFGDMLREIESRSEGYALHPRVTSVDGRVDAAAITELCPDWREREVFQSGPESLMSALRAYWEEHGDCERLRQESFQPVIGEGDAEFGEGGTVRFRVTDFEATCDPGTSILVAAERCGGELPHGCRMGICHTCVGRLQQGRVVDLRTGELEGKPGDMVRTCVTGPVGHVEIDL